MTKKLVFLFYLFICYSISYAQVGVGHTLPVVTLDVASISTDAVSIEGFIGPRLSGNQLTAKNAQYGMAQNATIVYVTEAASATTGKTMNVKKNGYYFYDATANAGSGLWVSFADQSKWQFYIPTILLPTDPYTLPDNINYSYTGSGTTTTYRVDLYAIYKDQLGSPKAFSNNSASLRTGASANDFNYFVLYYDTSVFNTVSVSSLGVLSYRLKSGYILSDRTFMSVVFREK